VKTTPGTKLRPQLDVAGTPGFMAPELNSNKPFDASPTDIFSAGCTLLELTYGNSTVDPLVDISFENASSKLSQMQEALSVKRDSEGGPPLAADSEDCLDMIACTLCIEAKHRLSATKCLSHPFLAEVPGASRPRPRMMVGGQDIGTGRRSSGTLSTPRTPQPWQPPFREPASPSLSRNRPFF